MSEWKTYKLGEICKNIAYGYTESASSDVVGPKFLRITDIQYDFISWDKVPYCPITKENHKKYKLEIGDIVIARTGASTGATAIFKDEDIDAVFASYLIRYKIDKEIAYPFYIGQLLKSALWRSYVASIIGGSAQPGANAKQFADFEFSLPSLATQTQIAQILSSLDDKIELNLQMNQTLEVMAQAIFKEWFVNFNFPGFDEELVDGLPKGWRKVKVMEQFEVTDYVANGSFASLAENVHYKNKPDFAVLIRLTDYNRGFNGDFVYLNEHSYNFLNKSKLFGDEIIIANVGANAGDVFRAPYLNKPMSLGPNAIMIKNNIASNYLYSFLISELGQHSLKSIIAGSVQPKFNKTDFRRLELIFPDEIILNLFNDIYKSINEKLLSNKSQIKSLTQTRDTLLPKLMSGKIEIAV